nr:hypothetical protein [Cytophagales bacterium]
VLRMDNLGIANVGLQSVVCGIDKEGNLLWDNSFELMNVARTNFRQMVQVAIEGDKVVFGYPTNGMIHAKAVRNTKTLMDNTTFAANAEGRSRGPGNAEKMSLAHWYGAQWLEWGTQVIEGQLNAQSNKQEVFYLNKIAYGPQLTTREDAPQKE